jgi:hypothetical protein
MPPREYSPGEKERERERERETDRDRGERETEITQSATIFLTSKVIKCHTCILWKSIAILGLNNLQR